MKVTLLDMTTRPLATCAIAAKTCYSDSSIFDIHSDINFEKKQEDLESYIGKIIKMGHLSVIEHVNYTFGIDGISRTCSHQLVRHRIASYSQQSHRYIQIKNRSPQELFVIPPEIENTNLKDKFFQECLNSLNNYISFIDKQISTENARFLLPEATKTNIVVTMNARELAHFFSLRCCKRAQWEINQVAWSMFRLCLAVTPSIFKYFGPDCIVSHCKQRECTCGKPYFREDIL